MKALVLAAFGGKAQNGVRDASFHALCIGLPQPTFNIAQTLSGNFQNIDSNLWVPLDEPPQRGFGPADFYAIHGRGSLCRVTVSAE